MSRPAFRKRNALAQHDMHYGPNMTPMVDVVMVILVFFMASAVFLGPEWFLRTALPIIKPAAAVPTSPDKKTLRIYLSNNEGQTRATIDDKPYTLQEVASLVDTEIKERTAANLTIVVVPTPDAPYEGVVLVHEFCQNKGITKIAIHEEDAPTANTPAVPIP